jgi:hypothetical protein
MPGKLEWYGDHIAASIRAELRRRINLCCLMIYNRCKELLKVEGAGIHDDSARRGIAKAARQAKAGRRAARRGIARATRNTKARHLRNVKAEASRFNKAHATGIGIGKIKRLRVTKAGTISNRRKPRKK